jgi:hypothetical protein
MIKKIVTCFFLCCLCSGYAQKIVLKGTVKDSLQKPLSYANVIAKPIDKTKNVQFAITDDEGYYKLQFNKGDTIRITISYLGFTTLNYQFVANQSTTKNFVLKASSEQLDEIVIEMPVTVKGDTTIYRTDKFVTGEERKLKNVLKKLPGVDVDKDGTVRVQGKKVTKMLVDGKSFFGGNSKLAVNNIPADAVDKVQVIQNYNEVAFLKNLTDTEEMAMNIELKEDKKRFLFGDVEAGKGNEDFYKTHANLFYYSPKNNINFIGNLNNFGEKTFTFKDYLTFQGGVNSVFNGDFDWKGGDFSQFLENKEVFASKQKFAATNIVRITDNNFDVSGFLIFSQSDTENRLETLNDYSSFVEQRDNAITSKNGFGIGKINIDYTPNDLEKVYVKTQLKKTNNDRQNGILSVIGTDSNRIINNKDLEATSLDQNIEWHKRFSEKHTFSSVINYRFNKNNQDAFWSTSDDVLQGLLPVVTGQQETRIEQIKDVKRQNFDGVFKHFWEVNANNHIYTTLANKYVKETFVTDEQQILDNGSVQDFTADGYGNHTVFKLNDFFMGLQYKFRTGIFTVKQGFNIHNYQWKVDQSLNAFQKNKWVVLPDFLAKIKLSPSKKIQVRYNLKTSFSDASKLANRFYLLSYNSVFRGNEGLENNLYHNVGVSYSRFSMFRGLMLILNANYSKRARGAVNSVGFSGNNQFLTYAMVDNPTEDFMFRANIEKRIKKIKYRVIGAYTNSDFLQGLNGTFQQNTNENVSYEIGVETLYEDFPTIEIGLRKAYGNFTSVGTTKFVTTEPFFNIDYDFLKGFIFSFDYTRSNYQNKTFDQKSIFEIANFKLSYKKENSGWSYTLMANNLFNTKYRRDNSFSTYLVSDTRTFVLPRVVMFSLGYNL